MKIKDIILYITGLYPFVNLYKESKPLIKITFCKHQWSYWKSHLHCKEHQGIDDTILVKWRRCDCCGKKQEMDMLPGNWYWKKSNISLPEDSDTIHFNVDLNSGFTHRIETISDKRNKKLNQILR